KNERGATIAACDVLLTSPSAQPSDEGTCSGKAAIHNALPEAHATIARFEYRVGLARHASRAFKKRGARRVSRDMLDIRGNAHGNSPRSSGSVGAKRGARLWQPELRLCTNPGSPSAAPYRVSARADAYVSPISWPNPERERRLRVYAP